MNPDDNAVDLAPMFTGEPLAPSAPTYVCDHVVVQIVVARHEGGHKVAEVPFNAIKLLYPYDLAGAIELALARAQETGSEAQG